MVGGGVSEAAAGGVIGSSVVMVLLGATVAVVSMLGVVSTGTMGTWLVLSNCDMSCWLE